MVPSPNFNQSYIQLGCTFLLRGITPPTDGLGRSPSPIILIE